MSFDLLPADLLLKIFHQLPLKSRVRLSGVNRLFRDISMESIAKMKSLVVNNHLVDYSIWNQKLSSLFESCSATLQSISVCNDRSYKRTVNALVEFVYPKLEHLEITVYDADYGQLKKLISRNRNLRSVILSLYSQFEWPEDIVFEKLEKLEIRVFFPDIDLSPILGPLISKIPNLKHLSIECVDGESRFTLSAQEFSQLLASTPDVERLYLDLCCDVNIYLDFQTAISTWRLPKLTTFYIDLDCPDPSSILQHFPVSFPRLKWFTSRMIEEIDDQALHALSQLRHLRGLYLTRMDMTMAEVIDFITALPLISTLKIHGISDVSSPEEFIDFLTSTAAIFRRDVEINVPLYIEGNEPELEDVLEGMKNSGGPEVNYYRMDVGFLNVISINYKSLEG